MNDIKIFVSNRIDIDSMQVNNPLYIPVRCGAYFDTRENNKMIGDDTGDNISEKRNSFCEFTVQYWAWKNVQADYYGLCHYRRYLSFSEKKFKANLLGQVPAVWLNDATIKKYDLLNEDRMRSIIQGNDIVVNPAADVKSIPTPAGNPKDVYGHWVGYDGVYIDKAVLLVLLRIIDQLHPEYSTSAQEYLRDKWHRGYNCFVMKKELFEKMCRFQFDVLFELERQLDVTEYTDNMKRTPGYIGEIMYGIFVYHLQKSGKYKIHETQLIYFEQTTVSRSWFHTLCQHFFCWLKIWSEDIGYVLLPKASRRREFIKKIYFSIVK